MNRYKTPRTCLRNSLLSLIMFLTIAAFYSSACYTDKKKSSTSIEVMVVFKLDVPVEKASSILFEKEYIFHSGTDNSKAADYMKNTGPKFIVQVPGEKVETFYLQMKNIPQIYEIYMPDWKPGKD